MRPLAGTTDMPLPLPQPHSPPKPIALRWSAAALVGVSWISAGAFGMYIFCFYLAALPAGRMQHWNDNLSGLYDAHHPLAIAAMAVHLAAGAIILLLGPVQLIGALRLRWPALHRWVGRVYVLTSGFAGLGGTAFILIHGTIGGAAMNLGFGLYGALMALAAWETYRHARARRFEAHRAWSIRLFALAIGSWLYRMDYGIWLTAANGLGHAQDFHGPFDAVMAFFFYVPNLALAELFLRARRRPAHIAFRLTAAAMLNVATLVICVGTYYFLRYYWGPAILALLTGKLS